MRPDLKARVPREILEELIEEGSEAFGSVLEKLFNAAMRLEREEFLRAKPYERTPKRRGWANGYKPKRVRTRVGELKVEIPQVRGLSFYPRSLEKGCRSEKALKLAIAESTYREFPHARSARLPSSCAVPRFQPARFPE